MFSVKLIEMREREYNENKRRKANRTKGFIHSSFLFIAKMRVVIKKNAHLSGKQTICEFF